MLKTEKNSNNKGGNLTETMLHFLVKKILLNEKNNNLALECSHAVQLTLVRIDENSSQLPAAPKISCTFVLNNTFISTVPLECGLSV